MLSVEALCKQVHVRSAVQELEVRIIGRPPEILMQRILSTLPARVALRKAHGNGALTRVAASHTNFALRI